MMADRDQEALWVLRAQLGARDALDSLFRAVQGPLYRCLRGLVGQPTLAEDLLQDVLLRIYRKLGSLREPALFRAWCYRIATREAFRRLGRERAWEQQLGQQDVLDGLATPAAEDASSELLDALPRLLGCLSPASRTVLALHYEGELSLDEVAEALALPLGTVKSRLAYGLAALRRWLTPEVRDVREAEG